MTTDTPSNLLFCDYHPTPTDFLAEVRSGLNLKNKQISPKFFYDHRGSQLFEAICEQPEYYQTRTEIEILRHNKAEIAELIGPDCLLIEPGSGNSQKVRILLDALNPKTYIPIDISKQHLEQTAHTLAGEYPWLTIFSLCADFTTPLALPKALSREKATRRVVFFPGSSIGNFEPRQAVLFMRGLAQLLGSGGGLLIGVDLEKDHDRLNSAYSDKKGVTAEFNLNLLRRINRELKGDFDLCQFQHCAFYNGSEQRIEMHLQSRIKQTVAIDSHRFDFNQGERIHTENSYKYSVESFQGYAAEAGFSAVRSWTDPDRLFSVHYFKVN